VASTGDIELATLDSVTDEAQLAKGRRSMRRLAGFPERTGYHVHTTVSAHLGLVADALEDAGCSDAAIVGHLRSAGPHVRGCWPVDLILSKDR
jgi:hypothetical protein